MESKEERERGGGRERGTDGGLDVNRAKTGFKFTFKGTVFFFKYPFDFANSALYLLFVVSLICSNSLQYHNRVINPPHEHRQTI